MKSQKKKKNNNNNNKNTASFQFSLNVISLIHSIVDFMHAQVTYLWCTGYMCN